MLCRAPNMLVGGHHAHPSGRALVIHFSGTGVTHSHANVYLPADGDLEVLQEVPD